MVKMEMDCELWIFEKASGCQFFKGSSLARKSFKFEKMLLQCELSSRNCSKSFS